MLAHDVTYHAVYALLLLEELLLVVAQTIVDLPRQLGRHLGARLKVAGTVTAGVLAEGGRRLRHQQDVVHRRVVNLHVTVVRPAAIPTQYIVILRQVTNTNL